MNDEELKKVIYAQMKRLGFKFDSQPDISAIDKIIDKKARKDWSLEFRARVIVQIDNYFSGIL